jgi:hypothetical protein
MKVVRVKGRLYRVKENPDSVRKRLEEAFVRHGGEREQFELQVRRIVSMGTGDLAHTLDVSYEVARLIQLKIRM